MHYILFHLSVSLKRLAMDPVPLSILCGWKVIDNHFSEKENIILSALSKHEKEL